MLIALLAFFALLDNAAVASRIHDAVAQYFAHWDAAPRDAVDAAYREYLDQLSRTADRRSFDLATLRFVAALRNGHTQFFDDRADGRPLKFRLLEIERQWVVIGSQLRALPRGTVVRSIDGRPAGDVLGELSRYVSASNDRSARANVFNYPLLFPERISLGLEDDTTVVVDRSVPADAPIVPLSASEGRWLEQPRIAYIRVPSFGGAEFERTALDLVRQFSESPNLIVDVRGNRGGTTPGDLMGALMDRPWRSWQATGPLASTLLGRLRPGSEQTPSPGAYSGRVFVLADRFCISACEDFVMPFKDTARGVVIGETTDGSSGNPYRIDLGDGMRISIGAVRYRFPDGRPFEGVGIAPDVPVALTIGDLKNRRDAVLDRAIALARTAR